MMGDCHVHMVMDGIYWKSAILRHRCQVDENWVREVLKEYQKAGVTYLRDGGDNCGAALLAAKLAPEYGIDYRMPVYAIHRNKRYGSIVGIGYSDLSDFQEMMRDAARKGADFIKIMVSGILDFNEFGKMSCPPLPADEIRQLVDMVHDQGLAVMLHINESAAILPAIEAGADSLEHGFYMDEECLAALGEHRDTVWVPSISPVGNQIGSGRFPDQVLEAIVGDQSAKIRTAVKAGARVALGSDAGAYLVPHVTGMNTEYTWLKKALTPIMTEDAIRSMLAENEEFIRKRFRRS